jgi:hypothetical protein
MRYFFAGFVAVWSKAITLDVAVAELVELVGLGPAETLDVALPEPQAWAAKRLATTTPTSLARQDSDRRFRFTTPTPRIRFQRGGTAVANAKPRASGRDYDPMYEGKPGRWYSDRQLLRIAGVVC